MTMTEKLRLHKELESRNAARQEAYLRFAGIHDAIEIYAVAIIESLNNLADLHALNRAELLELLVNTCWALEQVKEQED